MLAQPALAQSNSGTLADFGPPRPGTMQDPGIATPSASDTRVYAEPGASEPAHPVIERAPAVIEEEAPAATVVEAPAAPVEADAYATTRRAAPDAEPAHDRRDANPQTGHYLGDGLFNNWGPNDFGA
jgi:hypothetical protein